jgi:hypothetical protein
MQLLRCQLLVHRRSLHRCRCDEVGGDAVRRQLECDVPDELVHSGLGGTEQDHAVARMPRWLGAEIEQTAIAMRSHPRHNGFGDKVRGM